MLNLKDRFIRVCARDFLLLAFSRFVGYCHGRRLDTAPHLILHSTRGVSLVASEINIFEFLNYNKLFMQQLIGHCNREWTK
jgi:hypothetical protein